MALDCLQLNLAVDLNKVPMAPFPNSFHFGLCIICPGVWLPGNKSPDNYYRFTATCLGIF